MATSSAIELPNRPRTSVQETETSPLSRSTTGVVGQSQEQEFSLPPADGGVRAWLFLAGCFFIEALVWGLPFSYGLFQDYYTNNEPFKSHPNGIAAIGTTALGVMYLGSPLCFMAMRRWPFILRWSTRVGLVILIASMISSSFATEVWQLVLTQGALYAIGGSLVYNPIIIYVDEWFIRRKGLAFGVMWAGTGFAGVSFPFVMSWLLSTFSLRTTLLAWAITLTTLSTPLLFVIGPRIPESQRHRARRIDLGFLKSRTFLFIQLGNVIQGLGYFMPSIYLPTYARSLGFHDTAVTATVSLLNGATVFGCIFVGLLTDRFHVTTVILISTLGGTVSIFALWGSAVSIPVLCVFSIAYGFFAGGFSSTYAGVLKEMRDASNEVDSGLVMGILAAGRGIGSVICGPLSETLIKQRPWVGEAGLGYGSGFGPLIVFAGVTSFLGGVSFGARRLGWI